MEWFRIIEGVKLLEYQIEEREEKQLSSTFVCTLMGFYLVHDPMCQRTPTTNVLIIQQEILFKWCFVNTVESL